MITINKLTDLERFGIFYLTGEADNLAYRALCDVSQRGKDLLREVYGMDANSPETNSETNGEKHVASVMLPYRAWQDIGPISLTFNRGWQLGLGNVGSSCHTVFSVKDGTIYGMQSQELFKQAEYDWDAEPNRHLLPCNQKPPLLAPAMFSTDNGENWQLWPTCYGELDRMYLQASNQPHVGSRNVHAFSGKTFA